MSGDYSHDDYMPSLSVPIGQFHNTLMLIETINLIKLSTTDLQQPALSSHESLDEEDSLGQCILQAMDNKPIRTKNKKGGCSCKKTNCLKMYCECYSTGKVCTENCGCFGCQNCKETSLGTKP